MKAANSKNKNKITVGIVNVTGYAGVELDPGAVQVQVCGMPIYAGGGGLEFDRQRLIAAMRAAEVPIDIDLGQGRAVARIYTCDLSYDYVRINAEYTT